MENIPSHAGEPAGYVVSQDVNPGAVAEAKPIFGSYAPQNEDGGPVYRPPLGREALKRLPLVAGLAEQLRRNSVSNSKQLAEFL